MGLFKKKRDSAELGGSKKGIETEMHPPPPPHPNFSSELPLFPREPKKTWEMVLPPILEPEPNMPLVRQNVPRAKIEPVKLKVETKEVAPLRPELTKVEVAPHEVASVSTLKKEEVGFHKPVMKSEKDLYLNVDGYQQVINHTNQIENQLKALDKTTIKIDGLRSEEDAEFRKWRNFFDDMRKKLMFIDELLFESEG